MRILEQPSTTPASSGRQRIVGLVVGRLGALVAITCMSLLSVGAVLTAHSPSAGRLLSAFVVMVLAGFPGWLFLRFMAFRAGSLWTEYVLNLHRLGMDAHQNLPCPTTASGYHDLWAKGGGARLAASPNIYQQKFEAYYGQSATSASPATGPLTLRSLPPVLLATAVMAVGWCAVVARDPLLSDDLKPLVDPLRFGFMGAYVFVVQMLLRRYFQSDLKPSAYYAVVARVATVLVVVLVVHYAAPIGSPAVEVGTAFLIGFFPLLGAQIVQKVVNTAFRHVMPTLKTPYPLSDLDGLNIWYEARLLEEGIEDLQNLVTGNLVDIILHTRVPVERLVDWIDQAALQLLLDPPPDGDVSSRPRTDRVALRRLGVRTATDLETMFFPQERLTGRPSRTPLAAGNDEEFLAGMRRALNPADEGPSVTEALLRNFSNVPNLVHVRHWRDILGGEHDCCDADLLVEAVIDLRSAPVAPAIPASSVLLPASATA